MSYGPLAVICALLLVRPAMAADPVEIWTERLLAEVTRRAELAEKAVRDQSAAGMPSESEEVVIERMSPPSQPATPLTDVVRKILRDEGLSEHLIAVAQVESGMSLVAHSSKGARGIWQLMPDTARNFGLVVDVRRDDRLDPIKSTLAAARFLKLLYSRWGDWNLAFAAYNAGPGAVERALAGGGSWSLDLQRKLPTETREYVPKVWKEIHRMEMQP